MDIPLTPEIFDALIASSIIDPVIHETEASALSIDEHMLSIAHAKPDRLFLEYQNATICEKITTDSENTYESIFDQYEIDDVLTNSIFYLSPKLKFDLYQTYGDLLYPHHNCENYLKFLSKIENHFNPNNINQKVLTSPCKTNGKNWIIPAISHHIYLTKPGISTQEMRDKDLQNIFQKLSLLNSEDPRVWQHILWTNCKDCMPQTLQKIENAYEKLNDIKNRATETFQDFPFLNTENLNIFQKVLNNIIKLTGLNSPIEIRELKDYAVDIPELSFIESMHAKNLMGVAVDALRIILLKTYGGFYSDLNYELFESPAPYMKSHDFMAQMLNIYNPTIENYVLGATPHHPITHSIFNYIFAFIQNIEKYGYNIEQLDKEDITNFLALTPLKKAIIKHLNDTDFCGLPHDSLYGNDINDSLQYYPTDNFEDDENEIIGHYCYTSKELGRNGLDGGLSWV